MNDEQAGAGDVANPPVIPMEAPAASVATIPAEKQQKRRGRPSGSVGRRTMMARDLVERLGVDPLEALLKMVRNRRLAIEIRLDAAKAAVPYVYPRLSTLFLNARTETDVTVTLVKELGSDPQLALAMEQLSLAHTKALGSQQRVIDVTPED